MPCCCCEINRALRLTRSVTQLASSRYAESWDTTPEERVREKRRHGAWHLCPSCFSLLLLLTLHAAHVGNVLAVVRMCGDGGGRRGVAAAQGWGRQRCRGAAVRAGSRHHRAELSHHQPHHPEHCRAAVQRHAPGRVPNHNTPPKECTVGSTL